MKKLLKFSEYQENIKKGRLLGLLCQECNICMLPSQSSCYMCGNQNLKVKNLKKRGIITTFTVIHIAPAGFKAPYIVAIVRTVDNAYVMGNIIDLNLDKTNIKLIGRNVKIGFNRIIQPNNPYKNIFSLVFTV